MEVYAATTFLGCRSSASPVRRVLRSPAPPLFVGNTRLREETERGKDETAGFGNRRMEVAKKSNQKVLLFGYFIKLWVYQGWKRRERSKRSSKPIDRQSPSPARTITTTSTESQTIPIQQTDSPILQNDIARLKDTLRSITKDQNLILNERDDLLDTISQLGHKLEQVQYFVTDRHRGISGTRTSQLLLKNTTNLIIARFYRLWIQSKNNKKIAVTFTVPKEEVKIKEVKISTEKHPLLRKYFGLLSSKINRRRRTKVPSAEDCFLLKKFYEMLLQNKKNNKKRKSPEIVPQVVSPSGTLPVGYSVEDFQNLRLMETTKSSKEEMSQNKTKEKDYGNSFLELHEGINYERMVWFWWSKWTRHVACNQLSKKHSLDAFNIKILRTSYQSLVSYAGFCLQKRSKTPVDVASPKTPSSISLSAVIGDTSTEEMATPIRVCVSFFFPHRRTVFFIMS